MSNDWIKFRVKLVTDGRVRSAARKSKQKPATILGGLLILWSLADSHAEDDGTLPGYTFEDVDELVGVKGFAASLPPDWIIEAETGILLPNYSQHNGNTAKRRAESNRRVAEFREIRNGNATQSKPTGNAAVTQSALQNGDNPVTECVTREREEKEKRREETERESAASAARPPKTPRKKTSAPAKPRPRNPLFDALVSVTGVDPTTAGGLIASVAAKLVQADPPYTPADVEIFAKNFPIWCPYAEGRLTPTPKEIEKNIGFVRNPPKFSHRVSQPELRAEDDPGFLAVTPSAPMTKARSREIIHGPNWQQIDPLTTLEEATQP
ncbi:hypothetical protein KIH39_26400 [Telmatocola sphagniphila]|uniref:Uncharacterized protein n=1 Tax=Telmatocola sphagniphila TaxID=1123043 RepID=A0A8E6EYF4_9BACT|nr:hypothetical protein [Telmatocola sphagniphila]QVL32321.1 hypothetical protein KIH39_26400 [Telmatocola sphagniphila]